MISICIMCCTLYRIEANNKSFFLSLLMITTLPYGLSQALLYLLHVILLKTKSIQFKSNASDNYEAVILGGDLWLDLDADGLRVLVGQHLPLDGHRDLKNIIFT